MKYLLLVVSVLTGSAKSLLTKQIKSKEKDYFELFADNTLSFAVTLTVIFLISLFLKENIFNQLPLLLAVCYALCTLLSQICLLLATGSGSVSISSLFYSCGFIIPTFFGAIKYGEKITVLHVIAILMIVVSFIFGASRENGKKFNFKWLFFAVGGLIFSGLVGVLQKVFRVEHQNASLNGFLIVAFLIIVAISLSISLLMAVKSKKNANVINRENTPDKKGLITRIIISLLLGVSIATVNLLNTYLSGVLPGALFFPCVNGGAISITAIASSIIFKEKLTVKKTVGIALCVVAIILIGIANAL